MSHRFWSGVVLTLGLSAMPAFGQFFSVGIEGGVPLNDVFVNSGGGDLTANTNRFIVGPKLELGLPFHLGVEVDALYRHYSFSGSGVSEWDFPLLLKYHFRGVPLVHPFVDGGPIFNHVSNLTRVTPNQSTAGLSIGAGIDFHALLIHVEPEFRYVRWGSQNFNYSTVGSGLGSNQNQAEFLVGLTF